MKVYLAGPMRGKPDENRTAFEVGAKALRGRGHLVFSPIENSTPEGGLRAAMASDLNWICLCADAVVLLDGWEDSLGASAEYATANSIGVPTYGLFEFLDLK